MTTANSMDWVLCSRHWALLTPLHLLLSTTLRWLPFTDEEPEVRMYTQISFPNLCTICHSAIGTPARVKHANLNNMADWRAANAPLSLLTCMPLRVPNSTTRKMFTISQGPKATLKRLPSNLSRNGVLRADKVWCLNPQCS